MSMFYNSKAREKQNVIKDNKRIELQRKEINAA